MIAKILSHNVYWFQGCPFIGDRPGPPNGKVFEELCGLYQQASAAILCLQEVQCEQTALSVSRAMKMDVTYTPGNISRPYGSLIATNLGSITHDEDLSPSRFERSFSVAEIAVCSSTLKVGCVHLTSGRQTGASGAPAVRRAEITEFLETHGSTTDVLAGDFNENPDGDVAKILKDSGFLDSATLFGMESIATTVHSPNRRDIIWIKEHLRERILDYGVMREEIMLSNGQKMNSLSDHCPLWISLSF